MPVSSPPGIAAALLAARAPATSALAGAQCGVSRRPIRAAVPFPGGGSPDPLARVVRDAGVRIA